MPTPIRPTKARYSTGPRTIDRMPTVWEQENRESGRNLFTIIALCAIGSLALVATVLYWLVIR